VRALCGDPERAARFGAAGRRRVEVEFSWERIAERTLAIYRDAIANHEAGRA
jgi:starch synthase